MCNNPNSANDSVKVIPQTSPLPSRSHAKLEGQFSKHHLWHFPGPSQAYA